MTPAENTPAAPAVDMSQVDLEVDEIQMYPLDPEVSGVPPEAVENLDSDALTEKLLNQGPVPTHRPPLRIPATNNLDVCMCGGSRSDIRRRA